MSYGRIWEYGRFKWRSLARKAFVWRYRPKYDPVDFKDASSHRNAKVSVRKCQPTTQSVRKEEKILHWVGHHF